MEKEKEKRAHTGTIMDAFVLDNFRITIVKEIRVKALAPNHEHPNCILPEHRLMKYYTCTDILLPR